MLKISGCEAPSNDVFVLLAHVLAGTVVRISQLLKFVMLQDSWHKLHYLLLLLLNPKQAKFVRFNFLFEFQITKFEIA